MKSSLRLFKQDLELQLRSICNFSSRHKLQLFPPALIELARDKIDQYILIPSYQLISHNVILYKKFVEHHVIK